MPPVHGQAVLQPMILAPAAGAGDMGEMLGGMLAVTATSKVLCDRLVSTVREDRGLKRVALCFRRDYMYIHIYRE